MSKVITNFTTDLDFRRAINAQGGSLKIDSTPEQVVSSLRAIGGEASFGSPFEQILTTINGDTPTPGGSAIILACGVNKSTGLAYLRFVNENISYPNELWHTEENVHSLLNVSDLTLEIDGSQVIRVYVYDVLDGINNEIKFNMQSGEIERIIAKYGYNLAGAPFHVVLPKGFLIIDGKESDALDFTGKFMEANPPQFIVEEDPTVDLQLSYYDSDTVFGIKNEAVQIVPAQDKWEVRTSQSGTHTWYELKGVESSGMTLGGQPLTMLGYSDNMTDYIPGLSYQMYVDVENFDALLEEFGDNLTGCPFKFSIPKGAFLIDGIESSAFELEGVLGTEYSPKLINEPRYSARLNLPSLKEGDRDPNPESVNIFNDLYEMVSQSESGSVPDVLFHIRSTNSNFVSNVDLGEGDSLITLVGRNSISIGLGVDTDTEEATEYLKIIDSDVDINEYDEDFKVSMLGAEDRPNQTDYPNYVLEDVDTSFIANIYQQLLDLIIDPETGLPDPTKLEFSSRFQIGNEPDLLTVRAGLNMITEDTPNLYRLHFYNASNEEYTFETTENFNIVTGDDGVVTINKTDEEPINARLYLYHRIA